MPGDGTLVRVGPHGQVLIAGMGWVPHLGVSLELLDVDAHDPTLQAPRLAACGSGLSHA